MNRAVNSPDSKLIYSVIIDSYQTTKVMKPIADDDHMLNAAHVINVINVLDKYYSNAQIFWLLPLQLVYTQDSEEKQEDYIIRWGRLRDHYLRTSELKLAFAQKKLSPSFT